MPCRPFDTLTELQARMVLNAVPELGPISRQRLLQQTAGDPRAALRLLGSKASAGGFDLEKEETALRRLGARFLPPDQPGFPKLLPQISDPPVGLYHRGRLDLAQPCVAIVGTRSATSYGRETARRLGREFCQLGFCVVSGLASGVDAAAHEGALEVGGNTVGVLGTGIDRIYPPGNRDLFRRIPDSGALLSELPLGRSGSKMSFPMRNRLISGISSAIVVVESDLEGGAMITARLAVDQGRTVFAIPGRIDQRTSAGCHQLIREGATLLTRAEDVLAELPYLRAELAPGAEVSAEPHSRRSRPALTPDEKAVLQCFQGGALLTPDQLTAETRFTPGTLSALLLCLELKGRVEKQLDGRWSALTSTHLSGEGRR